MRLRFGRKQSNVAVGLGLFSNGPGLVEIVAGRMLATASVLGVTALDVASGAMHHAAHA